MYKILFGLLILAGLYSCSGQRSQKGLLDITSRIDEASGFINLTLNITDKKETDSTFIYTAKGLFKSDTVGIQVSLKKNIKAGIVNGEMKNIFVRNGISLKSIGVKSDRLLSSMIELYGIDSINSKMRNDLMVLTCANLNQQDLNYNSGEFKFKVFMETDQDVPELFVDFDFSNGLVYLNEKDVGYRQGVLSYLMKK